MQIKSGGEDLSYITIELLDKNGNRNTKAANLLHFTIEGPGAIAGVGNANPVSSESYQAPERKAWQGRCLVVVRSTAKNGNIVLKASAEGLPAAIISVVARK